MMMMMMIIIIIFGRHFGPQLLEGSRRAGVAASGIAAVAGRGLVGHGARPEPEMPGSVWRLQGLSPEFAPAAGVGRSARRCQAQRGWSWPVQKQREHPTEGPAAGADCTASGRCLWLRPVESFVQKSREVFFL